jgi:hypothetical protein
MSIDTIFPRLALLVLAWLIYFGLGSRLEEKKLAVYHGELYGR